jgi:hypothetical protein
MEAGHLYNLPFEAGGNSSPKISEAGTEGHRPKGDNHRINGFP